MPPRAKVEDAQAAKRDKPSAGARFLWGFCCCLAAFLLLIFSVGPRNLWLLASLGSLIFAGFSGLVAMCIPVKSKLLFTVPPVMLSLLIAYLAGSSSS
jgi:hypothetical protein